MSAAPKWGGAPARRRTVRGWERAAPLPTPPISWVDWDEDHAVHIRRFLSPLDGPLVRAIKQKKEEIRRPPKPPTWDSGYGYCRLCGEEVREFNGYVWVWKNKRRWHPECLARWAIATTPAIARAYLFNRDRGVCAGCGDDTIADWPADRRQQTIREVRRQLGRLEGRAGKAGSPIEVSASIPKLGPWEGDHFHELWLVDRAAEGALSYWLLENLQTLCKRCHTCKTTAGANARKKIDHAQIRRGVKKPKVKMSDIPF